MTHDISVFQFQNEKEEWVDIDVKDKRTLKEVGIGEGTIVASMSSKDKMKEKSQNREYRGGSTYVPPKPKSEEEKHYDKLRTDWTQRVNK